VRFTIIKGNIALPYLINLEGLTNLEKIEGNANFNALQINGPLKCFKIR